MANLNTAKWLLLPVCTSINGRNKSAPIVCENQSVKLKLEPTTAPFGAGNFNVEEKVRMNLDLSCSESHLKILTQIDEWALKQLSKDSKLYFKKELSDTELRAAYRPCATPHEKNGVAYPPTMRLKIMTDGPNKIRCWTPDRQPRPMPEDWRNCRLTAQSTVQSIWLMNGAAGVLFQCCDVIVEEQSMDCPWDSP